MVLWLSMRSLIGNWLTSNCYLFQIVSEWSHVVPGEREEGCPQGTGQPQLSPQWIGGMATGRPKWMATEEPLRGRAGLSTSPSAGTEKKKED